MDIKHAGFEPAIWLAPFIASPKSRLLREHPEYFVADEAGKPLCTDQVTFPGWRDGPWYMLDGTNPRARQYIYDVVKTIYQEWGVKYFKLDANVWGALPFGVRYDKKATAVEAYRRMMETIWDATGDDAFILGCNAPMWPSLGLVSGMRITNDTSRNFRMMKTLTGECFPRNWMNGVLWQNDPDCLLMRKCESGVMDPRGMKRKASRNRRMYRFNNIYIRASGGSILTGDFIETYQQEDLNLFRRLITLPKIAASFERNFEVGTIRYDNTTEYCIFNLSKWVKSYTFPVPADTTVTDMYSGKLLCPKNGQIKIKLYKNSAAWIALERRR